RDHGTSRGRGRCHQGTRPGGPGRVEGQEEAAPPLGHPHSCASLHTSFVLCVRPRHEDSMKALLTIAFVILITATPLVAQGWIEPAPGIRCACAVQRTRTTVSVHVTGRIARVEVEEWFRNDGVILGQGDYLYPLPGEAVFSNFSLFQGDQELRGETMD